MSSTVNYCSPLVYSVRNKVNERKGNGLVPWLYGQTTKEFILNLKRVVGATSEAVLRIEFGTKFWISTNLPALSGFKDEVPNREEITVYRTNKRTNMNRIVISTEGELQELRENRVSEKADPLEEMLKQF